MHESCHHDYSIWEIRVNWKLRDEHLAGEIFYTFLEAKVLIERWRQEYNWIRPNSALGNRPPAPEAVMASAAAGPASLGYLALLRPPPGGSPEVVIRT